MLFSRRNPIPEVTFSGTGRRARRGLDANDRVRREGRRRRGNQKLTCPERTAVDRRPRPARAALRLRACRALASTTRGPGRKSRIALCCEARRRPIERAARARRRQRRPPAHHRHAFPAPQPLLAAERRNPSRRAFAGRAAADFADRREWPGCDLSRCAFAGQTTASDDTIYLQLVCNFSRGSVDEVRVFPRRFVRLLCRRVLGRAAARFHGMHATAPPAAAAGKPVIAVSIFPVASLVEQLTDGWAEVVTLLPASASPHDAECTPDQLRLVARADLLVVVGAGLDPWAEKAASSGRFLAGWRSCDSRI